MAALPRLLALLAWAPAAAAPQQGLRFVSTHLVGHQMDPRTAAGKEDFHSPYRRFHYAMYHGVPGSHTLFGQGAALESGNAGLSWRNTSYPWPFPPPAMRTNGGANGGTASAAMLPSGQSLAGAHFAERHDARRLHRTKPHRVSRRQQWRADVGRGGAARSVLGPAAGHARRLPVRPAPRPTPCFVWTRLMSVCQGSAQSQLASKECHLSARDHAPAALRLPTRQRRRLAARRQLVPGRNIRRPIAARRRA